MFRSRMAFSHVAEESKNGGFQFINRFIDYVFSFISELANEISHVYWEMHGLND